MCTQARGQSIGCFTVMCHSCESYTGRSASLGLLLTAFVFPLRHQNNNKDTTC